MRPGSISTANTVLSNAGKIAVAVFGGTVSEQNLPTLLGVLLPGEGLSGLAYSAIPMQR